MLSEIATPAIRRDVCDRVEIQKIYQIDPLSGIPVTKRLKYRYCFLSSVQPANLFLLVLSWARVRRDAQWECCFGVMYGECYGLCDFVVLSVVEVCVDYGGVNAFYVCLDFWVVYGVGVCVNVCGVVCVVVCCLFLTSGCCLLCCDVVGVWRVVIFLLSVMRVDVVCW